MCKHTYKKYIVEGRGGEYRGRVFFLLLLPSFGTGRGSWNFVYKAWLELRIKTREGWMDEGGGSEIIIGIRFLLFNCISVRRDGRSFWVSRSVVAGLDLLFFVCFFHDPLDEGSVWGALASTRTTR